MDTLEEQRGMPKDSELEAEGNNGQYALKMLALSWYEAVFQVLENGIWILLIL